MNKNEGDSLIVTHKTVDKKMDTCVSSSHLCAKVASKNVSGPRFLSAAECRIIYSLFMVTVTFSQGCLGVHIPGGVWENAFLYQLFRRYLFGDIFYLLDISFRRYIF